MRENRSAYQRIWFRPRVLRDVTTVDYSSTILGMPVSLLRSVPMSQLISPSADHSTNLHDRVSFHVALGLHLR